jgi:glutaredoxin
MEQQMPLLEEGGQNKRRTVRGNPKTLVIGKVYANWCGHCKDLKTEWSHMKGIIKKRKHGVEYVEIEENEIAKKGAYLKQKYGVEVNVAGYPTIFKVQNGHLDYYNGERSAEKLAEWYLAGNAHNRRFFRGGKTRRRQTRRTKKTKGFFGMFF